MKKIIAASALMCAVASEAMAEIKVGILHSLSGTMAISETTLKDTMLMLIDEQNAKGGLLGEKIVPVVVDPASTGRCSPKRRASFSQSTKWI